MDQAAMSQHSHMYKTPAWRAFRLQWLAEHPLCALHLQLGQTVKANTVDHVERHGGDYEAFWRGPFQSLCGSCHSRHKQAADHRGGVTRGCDASGHPTSPLHHWNRKP
jgi:hypothetical protein